MDNREAIEWLKGCVVAYEVDNKGKPNGNVTCELIQEVIDMAISALEKQEQDRWVPVTERLPEEPDEVLVTDGDGEIRHAVYCHVCKKDVFITYEESMTIHQVIAWRPLPEPYTEEES